MKIYGANYVQEFELNGKTVTETVTDNFGHKETNERDFSYMAEMVNMALEDNLKIEY